MKEVILCHGFLARVFLDLSIPIPQDVVAAATITGTTDTGNEQYALVRNSMELSSLVRKIPLSQLEKALTAVGASAQFNGTYANAPISLPAVTIAAQIVLQPHEWPMFACHASESLPIAAIMFRIPKGRRPNVLVLFHFLCFARLHCQIESKAPRCRVHFVHLPNYAIRYIVLRNLEIINLLCCKCNVKFGLPPSQGCSPRDVWRNF